MISGPVASGPFPFKDAPLRGRCAHMISEIKAKASGHWPEIVLAVYGNYIDRTVLIGCRVHVSAAALAARLGSRMQAVGKPSQMEG